MLDSLDRRAFLAQLAAARIAAPETDDPQRKLAPYMKHEADALAAHWDEKRAEITTPEAMHERNRYVRECVRAMLGPRPTPCALEAKITRSTERDGYRIENLMFQSRPGLWVTGNLYIPAGSGPRPGIISPCGHYELSRMYPDYQYAYIDLVRSGFVVLAYDPIGQGERRHYWNTKTRTSDSGLRSVDEHSMEGQLLLLLGQNLTRYLVEDGLRAIDYLLTRPEVDRSRIGCAGHSGGGTLTMFLACADERIQCVAINEGGTIHRWPVTLKPDGSLPISDAEQNLFPAAIYGVDACDMNVAIAPRPLLVSIEHYTPEFDETASHIRARYKLLGAPERFETVEARARHAWTDKLRLATVDWFCRWFYHRTGPTEEGPLRAESPETLYCTPNGSLREAQIGSTIFSIVGNTAARLPRERNPQITEIRNVLRLPDSAGRPMFHTSLHQPLQLARHAMPVLLFNDAPPETDAIDDLTRAGIPVLAASARGLGTLQTSKPNRPFGHLFDQETAATYLAWSLDRCLFGMRVFDVLQCIEFAASAEALHAEKIQLIGKGPVSALLVLYAAALDARVSTVISHGGLFSYRALTSADRYSQGAHVFIRDVLLHFDLTDLPGVMEPRRVVLMEAVDAMENPARLKEVSEAYAPHRNVHICSARSYVACLN